MRENRAGIAKAIFLAVAEKGINGEQLQMTHNARLFTALYFSYHIFMRLLNARIESQENWTSAWYRGGNLKSLIIVAICGNSSPACLHSRVLHTRFVRFFTRVRLSQHEEYKHNGTTQGALSTENDANKKTPT